VTIKGTEKTQKGSATVEAAEITNPTPTARCAQVVSKGETAKKKEIAETAP